METEAGTWKRKRMEAYKRDFLKKIRKWIRLGSVYPYVYIYILKYKN